MLLHMLLSISLSGSCVWYEKGFIWEKTWALRIGATTGKWLRKKWQKTWRNAFWISLIFLYFGDFQLTCVCVVVVSSRCLRFCRIFWMPLLTESSVEVRWRSGELTRLRIEWEFWRNSLRVCAAAAFRFLWQFQRLFLSIPVLIFFVLRER